MKRFSIVLTVFFSIFIISGNVFADKSAGDSTVVLSAGNGIYLPIGDLRDSVKRGILMFASYQREIKSKLTFEGEFQFGLYLKEASKVKDADLQQVGVGLRYWLNKAFNEVYIGMGIARTDMSIGAKNTSNITLVLKGGYILPFKLKLSSHDILFDVGVRYDCVRMDDWLDQAITSYAAACFIF